MTTKHTISMHLSGIDGWYTYRGVTIKRNDRHGAWWKYVATCGSICTETRVEVKTETLKQMLVQIDRFLDRK